MSKDYKIGVVIGLLILIAGVSYFVITRDRDDKTDLSGEDGEKRVEQVVYDDGDKGGGKSGSTVSGGEDSSGTGTDKTQDPLVSTDPKSGTTDVGEGIAVGEKDPATGEKDFIDPGFGEKTGTGSTAGKTEKDPGGLSVVEKDPFGDLVDPVDPAAGTRKSDSGGDSGFFSLDDKGETSSGKKVEDVAVDVTAKKGSGDMDLSWSGDKKATADDEPFFGRITPKTTDTTHAADAGVAAEKIDIEPSTYEVKSGDQGFWAIAAKVYGKENAKYYWKIRDANPEVNSISLRPGRVLKIPALKVSREVKKTAETGTATTTTTTTTDHGQVVTGTDGKRYYVVSKNDSTGFWGIAGKPEVYGNKQRYKLIRDANPQVNSNNMRAGTRLFIPPAPVAEPKITERKTIEEPAGGGTGLDTAAVSDDKKYYTVKKGDAGFWGISKKLYGSGKYSYLIRKANPKANPEMLRPGMKLVIPPLENKGTDVSDSRTTPVKRSTPSAPPWGAPSR